MTSVIVDFALVIAGALALGVVCWLFGKLIDVIEEKTIWK